MSPTCPPAPRCAPEFADSSIRGVLSIRPAPKRLLCPNRRRRTPAQFSWLDHRLMRERCLESCPVEAWALYLFLVTVGDAQGLSYYSDASLTARVTSAVLDRLLHHAETVTLEGNSFRMKDVIDK